MFAGSIKSQSLSFIVFLVFAGSFITALFFKENQLWMDEILSYLLISDRSYTHLNGAIVSGFEQTPPVFFNLYWLIAHAISLDVVFLKSVSIVFFAATLALFFRYTTKLIGNPAINFLLITGVAAFTYLNITLASQIRSYVPFLFVTFIYFTIIHRLIQRPTSTGLLAAHIGVGLLMTLTHNFGLFYLAAAGAFFGVLWLWSTDQRYWFVLGSFGVIGVVWLLGWYPFFAVQAKTGEPHSWIPLPDVMTFFRVVGELQPTVSNKLEESTGKLPLVAILRFAGLIALFLYIAVPKIRKGYKAAVADPAFMLYLLSGFIYAATITITLAVTFLHTSLFISRYLWPNHLLVIYQLIYAFYYFAGSRITGISGQRVNGLDRLKWVLPVYMLGLTFFLFYQSRKLVLTPASVMAYVDQLDKKAPVFLESSLNFLPIWYYNRDRPIHFLLDYESAFDPDNDPGATVGYHTLSAVKAQYNVGAVMPVVDFNKEQVPHFYVVDEEWNYQIERFIQNKSVKVVSKIPTTLAGFTILECVFTGSDSKVAEAAGQTPAEQNL
ncbi:hypothetical protein [Spirosoma oryzicola]|uniref:hypothetical protein n=1 Tax=Spirosoma oryzicola TaxID=2898794 RepID=UPI001E42017A|nr:hypothetical protein [Spirosoma oryzicola]UHG94267.1 hypothetical protein LQ777_26390 [Spirosoma oryzicola]